MHRDWKKLGKKFVRWLDKNNFQLNQKVKFKRIDDVSGFGLVAIEEMQENEDLFIIPQNMVLSPTTSQFASVLDEKNLQSFHLLNNWNRLILCLMWEWTNDKSLWRPYLDVLPLHLSTPLFWNDDDLKWLKGTDIETRIGHKEISDDYEKNILPIIKSQSKLFNVDIHNFSLYKRFGSIVMAYSFTKSDGEVAMMPMADMLNHKTGFNNARLFLENEGTKSVTYAMRTIKIIKTGDELYNTYGDLGNSELLLKYGFVDEVNPFNLVDIPFKLVLEVCKEKKLRNYKQKLAFLLEHQIIEDENDASFPLLSDGKIPNELDSLVRIFHSTDQEYQGWIEKFMQCESNIKVADEEEEKEGTSNSSEDDVIEEDSDNDEASTFMEESSSEDQSQSSTVQIEIADLKGTFNTLVDSLDKRLDYYPTTFAEDEILKQNKNLSQNNYNSLVVRMGEKEILLKCKKKLITKT